MSIKEFLVSRTFRKNLLGSFLIVFFLLVITFWSLKIYTRHGQENPVPDFRGLTYEQAGHSAGAHRLRVEISDSLYMENAAPGTVIKQYPEPGFKVKNNRTILLTINSAVPENVFAPKMTDISFRQAKALIENCGLTLGKISYKPSEFDNLVLEAYSGPVRITAGDKLVKGSAVDLVVGKASGDFQTPLPDLLGYPTLQAVQILNNTMLNAGAVVYDETVVTKNDTLRSVVWKQQPDPKVVPYVELGSSVDLWVTTDTLKVNPGAGPRIQ